MQHNRLHFINADLQNTLGYRSIIPSEGILADFICPEPGMERNTISHSVLSNLMYMYYNVVTYKCKLHYKKAHSFYICMTVCIKKHSFRNLYDSC